jgi:hypothetical protein
MEEVYGKAIIANAVIRKYKPKRISGEDRDTVFEFGPNSYALILINGERKSDMGKALYLYVSYNRLNFKFYSYGGFRDSRIYINHPQEKEIINEIKELTDKFEEIKLPKQIIQQVPSEDFDLYEPLESWAKQFIENFSPYLPEAKVLSSYPAS